MALYNGSTKIGSADEHCCAIFTTSVPKEGLPFYLFWRNSASDTRHVEEVTIERLSGSGSFTFAFIFGGTEYSASMSTNATFSFQSKAKPDWKSATSFIGQNETYKVDKALRIWAGSADVTGGGTQTPILAYTPEGIAAGLTAVVTWWQKDPSSGRVATGAHIGAPMQIDAKTAGKFSWVEGGDTASAQLNNESKQLGITFTNYSQKQVTATLNQEYPGNIHSHDFTPPKPPVENATLEVRYPQVNPALERIRSQMPFPSTLVETLTHTASFLDQAGYLAQYAVEKYAELDKAYHTSTDQNAACGKEIEELKGKLDSDESEMKRLASENKAEKDKNAQLEKSLKDARDAAEKREAELTKKIHDLQDTISKDQKHDAEDHKALDDAHKALEEEQAAKNALRKSLDQAETELVAVKSDNAALKDRLDDMTKKFTDAQAEVSRIKGELQAEKDANTALTDENKTQKEKIAGLEKQLADAQKALAETQKDLKQAQTDSDDKDSIIDGLEKGLVAIKKDRDAKKKAFEDLKQATDKTTKDLQDKLTKAEAHDLDDHKKLTDLQNQLDAAKTHDADDEKKIKDLQDRVDKLSPHKPAGPVRAAINRNSTPTDIYFFKDKDYARVNGVTDALVLGPRSTVGWWPAMKPIGVEFVDAALMNSAGSNEAYMFGGDNCVLYNVYSDKVMGSVFKWAEKWSCLKDAGLTYIDTVVPCFPESDSSQNHALFFEGTKCIRIDITTNTVVQGLTEFTKVLPVLAGFTRVEAFAFKVQKNFKEGYFFSGGSYVLVHLVEKRILYGPASVTSKWKSLSRAQFY